jgi:hypothetical protein
MRRMVVISARQVKTGNGSPHGTRDRSVDGEGVADRAGLQRIPHSAFALSFGLTPIDDQDTEVLEQLLRADV